MVTAQNAIQLNTVVTNMIELVAESKPDDPEESDN